MSTIYTAVILTFTQLHFLRVSTVNNKKGMLVGVQGTIHKWRHANLDIFWPTLWCHELISCLCPGAKKCIKPLPSLDDVLLKLIVKWSIIQNNIWTLDWNSLVFRWWSEYRVPGGYNRDQTSEYQTCKSPVFRCFCDSDVSVIQMSRIRIPTTKIFLEPSCSVQLYLQQAFKSNRALLETVH